MIDLPYPVRTFPSLAFPVYLATIQTQQCHSIRRHNFPMPTRPAIPRWILYYAAFLTLLSLSTALIGYFAPQRIFMNTGIAFDNAQPITFFYATRNMGIFVLGLFALLKRDGKMLFSLLLLRFVVELLDMIFTLKFGIGGFNPAVVSVVWTILFLVPEFAAAYTLYTKNFSNSHALSS